MSLIIPRHRTNDRIHRIIVCSELESNPRPLTQHLCPLTIVLSMHKLYHHHSHVTTNLCKRNRLRFILYDNLSDFLYTRFEKSTQTNNSPVTSVRFQLVPVVGLIVKCVVGLRKQTTWMRRKFYHKSCTSPPGQRGLIDQNVLSKSKSISLGRLLKVNVGSRLDGINWLMPITVTPGAVSSLIPANRTGEQHRM